MGWIDTLRRAFRPTPKPVTVPFTPGPAHVRPAAASATRYQSAYMSHDRYAELLQPGSDGMPPLCLAQHNGALWLRENTTGLLVNCDNRQLPRLGIWGAKLRGQTYNNGKAALGPAELVREPDNPHDPNAVAVRADGLVVGYLNKQTAKTIARLLDSDEPLVARFISTDPAKVLVTNEAVLRHISREL